MRKVTIRLLPFRFGDAVTREDAPLVSGGGSPQAGGAGKPRLAVDPALEAAGPAGADEAEPDLGARALRHPSGRLTTDRPGRGRRNHPDPGRPGAFHDLPDKLAHPRRRFRTVPSVIEPSARWIPGSRAAPRPPIEGLPRRSLVSSLAAIAGPFPLSSLGSGGSAGHGEARVARSVPSVPGTASSSRCQKAVPDQGRLLAELRRLAGSRQRRPVEGVGVQ